MDVQITVFRKSARTVWLPAFTTAYFSLFEGTESLEFSRREHWKEGGEVFFFKKFLEFCGSLTERRFILRRNWVTLFIITTIIRLWAVIRPFGLLRFHAVSCHLPKSIFPYRMHVSCNRCWCYAVRHLWYLLFSVPVELYRYIIIIIIIIIIWHYNALWVFSSSANSLQFLPSLAVSFQFLTFSFYRSSITSSCHRCLGLPSSSYSATALSVCPWLPHHGFWTINFVGCCCQPHAQPQAILEDRCFLSRLSPLADQSQF